MTTEPTTERAGSEKDRSDDESVGPNRQMLWHKGEGEATEMFQRGAPTHLVVRVLEVLAPMIEVQAADPFWAPPEYLKEIMSQPCWEVVSAWVAKIENDIYSAERDGLI